jgi:PIN domain nuclease of toxin-antitoxin system
MILDTCALLWLVGGDNRLSRSALEAINAASAVHVSAISGFEIAIKSVQGKLRLPLPAHEWFRKAIAHHRLTVLSLGADICLAAAQLPAIHDDPCDRFIIATAKQHGMSVVTGDARFEEYGVTVIC